MSDRSTPGDVIGLTSGVIAIVAGGGHTCALTDAGSVQCWGWNAFGQLGDGTTTPHNTPVDVVGLMSGVIAVAAGGRHTCAVTSAGGVQCWGANLDGELGDGTATSRATPVDVFGATSGITAVAAGGSHTCAIDNVGGLQCWGTNRSGELGNGTTTRSHRPVDVVGLTSGVTGVATGGQHTCATTSLGLMCWGHAAFGQLGDGRSSTSATAVDVVGLDGIGTAIAVGDQHACALTDAGGLVCWGDNFHGQLGNGGTVNPYSTPQDVVGLTSGVIAVAAGSSHTCALTDAGGLLCWGDNGEGQLGDGTTTDRSTPRDVLGLTSGVIAVAAGAYHTCALTDAGGLQCWGYNFQGQLGDGTTTGRPTPENVFGLTSGVTAVAAGGAHTCAITSAGRLQCWGYNNYGQLGDGTKTDRSTPTDVFGMTRGVIAVAAGAYHTCAIASAGDLDCWGWNESGQLGTARRRSSARRGNVFGLTGGVIAVGAGYAHTCAITSAGALECWGSNLFGQLGDGTTSDRSTARDVVGLASGINAVDGGGSHTCALTHSGDVKCWGLNSSSQLGNGWDGSQETPVFVLP